MSWQISLFDPSQITYDTKALEAHYTPDWLARYVVGSLGDLVGLRVMEPHAGGGAFLRMLAELAPSATVSSIDVDKNCWAVRIGGARIADFLGADDLPGVDVVVGNPPFSNAEDHLARALELAPRVVFILPVSRLETVKRAAFYDAAPLERIVLLPERVWPGSRHIGVFHFRRGHVGDAAFRLDPSVVDPDPQASRAA